MPCHHSGTTVTSSVQSVLQQTHSDFELVTVNDGSIDNRFDVISEFNDSCFHLITQQNAGVVRIQLGRLCQMIIAQFSITIYEIESTY